MSLKIVLFTSSPLSLTLIGDLYSKESLSCVVIPAKNDSEIQNLAQILNENNIPFFYFNENDEKSNLELLDQVQCDLALVFVFPYKLNKKICIHFNHHIFNLHASSLPLYRGSQPLFWQLKNGESKSALSLCRLIESFDEGDIVLQYPFEINQHDTFGILAGVISQMAVSLVNEFITMTIKQGIDNIKAIAQMGESCDAPKLTQNDIGIDWKTMNAVEIVNLIRACNPICGGAQTMWKNSSLSILEATVVDMPNLGLDAGVILHLGYPEGFIVSTIDGSIRIDVVSVPDGLFSGLRFAKRFNMNAGEKLSFIKQ